MGSPPGPAPLGLRHSQAQRPGTSLHAGPRARRPIRHPATGYTETGFKLHKKHPDPSPQHHPQSPTSLQQQMPGTRRQQQTLTGLPTRRRQAMGRRRAVPRGTGQTGARLCSVPPAPSAAPLHNQVAGPQVLSPPHLPPGLTCKSREQESHQVLHPVSNKYRAPVAYQSRPLGGGDATAGQRNLGILAPCAKSGPR